jgi:Tfp pilus assembly PilM family ATPase
MTLKALRKFARQRERRDEVVVIDLSTPITKAVHLRRKGGRLTLVSCCSQTAPPPEEISSPKELAKHFKTLRHSLGTKIRETVIVIGMEDSKLRNVESPLLDRGEMRHALRLNARQFFKEDMPDSVFDCFIPSVKAGDGASSPKAGKPSNVLVGIGKQGLPARLNTAAKLAGFHLAQIVPAQVGLANAALLAKGKMSDDEALVLLHFGANTSTVSFLSNGKLSLTRAIDIGGDQLGKELAEAHNVSIDDEKLRISAIQDNVQNVLEPIAKEVRAAIDYFDHLEGKPVMSGYVTGEMAQSSVVIETLKGLEIPCQRLDPTGFLGMEVPEENVAAAGNPIHMDLDTELPQLNVAVGAAVSWLDPEAIEINLLVDEIEAAERRRRDPVRWTAGLGAVVTLVLLMWAGWLFFQSVLATTHLRRAQADWKSLEKSHHEALAIFKKAGEIDRTLNPLQHHATNRFLWTLPLNALQLVMSDEIQVVGLKIEQTLAQVDAIKASKTVRAQPAQTKEQILMTITAKNFADNQAEDKFIERITSLPYFKNNLRKKEPVLLKNRLLRQVDPLDPTKVFTLFTIECVYPERVLGHE